MTYLGIEFTVRTRDFSKVEEVADYLDVYIMHVDMRQNGYGVPCTDVRVEVDSRQQVDDFLDALDAIGVELL